MNPGVVEEGGQTARTLISSMKDSPLTLAMVLFNLVFIAVVYYGTSQNRQMLDKIMNEMLTQQGKTMDMLYNCTPNKEH